MSKTLIKSVFNKLGFELKKIDQDSYNAEPKKLIEIVRNNTMIPDEGLISLYHQTLFCEESKLDGDFVECGVWKGGAVGLMALVNLKHGSARRHFHLFDSFEEICEPDEEVDGNRAIEEVKKWADKRGTKGRLVPLKGIYDQFGGPGTIQENKKLIQDTIGYDSQYLHFHKGWFQETLPEKHDEIDKIAILRLDGDWYASTKICLEYLFDKVVPGGFVIIDDYGAYDGCRKAVDEFLQVAGKQLFLNYVNPTIRYMIVPE